MDPLSDGDPEMFHDWGLRPPPLSHQPGHSASCRASSSDEFEDSPLVYRSMFAHAGPSHFVVDEGFDEGPLHRSLPSGPAYPVEDELMADAETSPCYRSAAIPEASPPCYRSAAIPETSPCYRSAAISFSHAGIVPSPPSSPISTLLPSPQPSAGSITPLDLPADLFDWVLHQLPCPDLFVAMRTSRAWCEAGTANYAQRQIWVAARPDALLECVQRAAAGDTLMLADGLHMLSRELTIDKPLRLLSARGPSPAVVCSRSHVVLRTRSPCVVLGLTVCRLGDEVGYPNTVVYAEGSSVSIEDCRVTCGGAAASVAEALSVFDGVPRAGEPASSQLPCPMDCAEAEDRGADRPQSGVWVGAAARVRLHRSFICGTIGPGVKIYRGELEASENTITNALRGANVVANGGRARLLCNEIHGAVGDGISSWNNAEILLERNRIHSNSGAGVTLNSSGGRVSITNNHIFNNGKAAVSFVTSQPNPAVLRENKLERNAGGSIQGLLQAGGPLPPQRSGGKAPQSRTLPMPAFVPVSRGESSSHA